MLTGDYDGLHALIAGLERAEALAPTFADSPHVRR